MPNDTTTVPIDEDDLIDELAQEIRRVDGDHSRGAASLAEALMPFFVSTIASAAQPVAAPHAQMTEEIDNILSDPDTRLSPGAERALRWLRTWTDAPLAIAAAPKAVQQFGAGDAVFAFASMLTALPRVVPFGSAAWATPGVELATAFNAANGLSVSLDFPSGIVFPKVDGDLLAVIEKAAAPQPAVQQGGPVVWRSWDSENSRWNFTLWPDEWAGHADAWEPLYTQPAAQAAQGDALDSDRLNWLEARGMVNIERVQYMRSGKTFYEITFLGEGEYEAPTLRGAIDAARAAQEGAKHG